MSNYTYEKLYIHAKRCGEIRSQTGVVPAIATGYDDLLIPHAPQYITAHENVIHQQQVAHDATKNMNEALARLAPVFVTTRTIVKVRTGMTIELPASFSEPGTDTALKNAIEQLVSIVDAHHGTPWADDIHAGPFAGLAADVIAKLDAYVEARLADEKAVTARSAAYDALYAPFLQFKELVRGVYGKASRNYRIINLVPRGHAPAETPTTSPTDAKPVEPSPSVPAVTAPAAPAATPTNGTSGPAAPTTG